MKWSLPEPSEDLTVDSLRHVLRTLLWRVSAFLLTAAAVTVGVSGATSTAQLGAGPPPIAINKTEAKGRAVELTVNLPPKASDGPQRALQPTAFQAYEGTKRLPTAAHKLADADLEVAVIADTQYGATDVKAVRAAVRRLITQLPSRSKVALIQAGSVPAVVTRMTARRQPVTDAVDKLKVTNGEAVVDAITLATDQFSHRAGVRRTVVVVAGVFSQSSGALRRATEKVTEANVSTYVIRTGDFNLGFQFPLPTGGGRVVSGSDADMAPAASTFAAELSSQYVVKFTVSGKADPVAIRLRVRTARRTLTGYTFVSLDIAPPSAQQRSALSLGLEIGGIALAVAGLFCLVYVPRRLAKSRAARRPITPLVVSSPAESAPGRASSEADHLRPVFRPSAFTGPGLGGSQVEGREAVRELLRAQRRQVRMVWLAEDVADEVIEGLADEGRVPLRRVSRSEFGSAARSPHPDGVLAHAAPLVGVSIDMLAALAHQPPSVIVVDHLTEVGLGAVIRTAVSCGVTGLVLPRTRSTPISPTTAAAARGAIEHMNMILTPNLPGAVAHLQAQGLVAIGIDSTASERLLDLDLDLGSVPVVLVIDGRGTLDDRLRGRCEFVVGVDLDSGIAVTPEAVGQRACIELARCRIPGAVR